MGGGRHAVAAHAERHQVLEDRIVVRVLHEDRPLLLFALLVFIARMPS